MYRYYRIVSYRIVVGSNPGRVVISWLLPGWETVCGQVNHLHV